VAPLLQDFTSRAAASMLHYSGVPVALDGDVISTAGTRSHVSEACGGIHYLVASAGIGYVYAGLVYRRWTRRAGFIAAAMVVPIAGNLVRVYTTIILDEFGATRLVAGMGHYLYGFFVFTMMMSVLFVTCGQWSDDRRPDGSSPGRRPDDSAYQPWRSAALATAALSLAVAPPLRGSVHQCASREGAVVVRGAATGFAEHQHRLASIGDGIAQRPGLRGRADRRPCRRSYALLARPARRRPSQRLGDVTAQSQLGRRRALQRLHTLLRPASPNSAVGCVVSHSGHHFFDGRAA
jgi:exosortase/archaeosortase family protein